MQDRPGAARGVRYRGPRPGHRGRQRRHLPLVALGGARERDAAGEGGAGEDDAAAKDRRFGQPAPEGRLFLDRPEDPVLGRPEDPLERPTDGVGEAARAKDDPILDAERGVGQGGAQRSMPR